PGVGLPGGLLLRRLLRDLGRRFRRCGLLGRLLGGGALLRSFLRGHVMALLVVGLRVADYGPALQDIAGVGPATNRRRAPRVETDLAMPATVAAGDDGRAVANENTRGLSAAGADGFGWCFCGGDNARFHRLKFVGGR